MNAVTNDQIIQAVFTATPKNKSRALAVLEGRDESPSRPPEDEAPLLMGMGDSAKLMGLSRATLWRMIRDGRLEKVEIYHNAFRLRRSDILNLVSAKRTSSSLKSQASPPRCPMDKQRFKKLYQLAHGGDMNAKADLWLEFEFAYDHDPLPSFMNPPALLVDSSSESSVTSVVTRSGAVAKRRQRSGNNKNQSAPPSCSSSLRGESSSGGGPC